MNPIIEKPAHFEGVIKYSYRKVDKGVAIVIYAQGMQSGSAKEALEDLEPYERIPSRTKNRVFSCSLNPHPDDQVSDEMFVQMAKDFMNRLGYGDQPFIIFKHTDIPRHHIHILCPTIDHTGKKINDKYQQIRARKIADELEIKYGLIKSKGENKEQRKADVTGVEKNPVNAQIGDIKKQIAARLKYILPIAYYQSVGELNCILSHFNISAEITKTEYKGKQYDGIVYFALDDNGNRVSNPIKSSDLGRGFGITAVQNNFKRSKTRENNRVLIMKTDIRNAIKKANGNLDKFTIVLKEKGIDLVIRKNEQGRIYGATYVDHEYMIALNGSRIDKSVSANALNLQFGNQEGITEEETELLPVQNRAEKIFEPEYNKVMSELNFFDSDFDENIEARWRRKLRAIRRKIK